MLNACSTTEEVEVAAFSSLQLTDSGKLVCSCCCYHEPIRRCLYSGRGRGQMPGRDEENSSLLRGITVLEHICDINGVTKVMLVFWTEEK